MRSADRSAAAPATRPSCARRVWRRRSSAATRRRPEPAGHVTEDFVGLADDLGRLEPLTAEQREKILERVRELQARVGFDGDYTAWIEAVTPPDLV